MRYLCLVYMENSVLGSRSPEQLAALNADSLDYNEVLLRNGRFVAAAALAPVSSATSVRLRRGDVSTTNGPFAETKEQLGGFILVEARDQADAARIASGIPLARLGATIEVRPIFEIPGADAAGHPSSGRPEPRIEVRPALALAGISGRHAMGALDGLGAQWRQFFSELPGRDGLGPPSYGLAYSPRDGAMELLTAVTNSSQRLPAGWIRREVPAQRYAVYPHTGHLSEIPRSIEWMLRHWLPGSGHVHASGFAGGLGHVERFGPGFDARTGTGDMELWFPLET
jgi:predicted transcriptional regulator YdeE